MAHKLRILLQTLETRCQRHKAQSYRYLDSTKGWFVATP